MGTELSSTLFCKKHLGIALKVTVNRRFRGYYCSEKGELINPTDLVEGMGRLISWEDLGAEPDYDSTRIEANIR
jgi:hypothetical protein